MKKLIGIIFISLMFANIGFAEMALIEEKLIKGKPKTSPLSFPMAKDKTIRNNREVSSLR